MILGIEIGGTKIQAAVGSPNSTKLVEVLRQKVEPQKGADGILTQVKAMGQDLVSRHSIEKIGIGFGGPIDRVSGMIYKSHQVNGWDGFNLIKWSESAFGILTVVANDCDVAALAESKLGAGKDYDSVFYLTVGTGIGGGFVVRGEMAGASRPAIAEIGHMRLGPTATSPNQTVESICSGTGIAHRAQHLQANKGFFPNIKPVDLTAEFIGKLSESGDSQANELLSETVRTLGWAVAQVITLNAPEMVIIGGGVSLIAESRFLNPLREQIATFVFPGLSDSYRVHSAMLGEEVVLFGAIQIAADHDL